MKEDGNMRRASGPRKKNWITCSSPVARRIRPAWLSTASLPPLVTSDRQLDWNATDLAVLNGRVMANRGVAQVVNLAPQYGKPPLISSSRFLPLS